MRKRVLAGILAAVLSLSLAACGDTKQTASTEAETVQAQDGEKGLKELFEEGKKADKKEETAQKETDQEDEEQETTEESLEEEDGEKEKDSKKETAQKDEKDKKNMVSPEDAEISDDWEDITFALDGTVFALPAPYGAFATQGWTINWDFFGKDTEYYVLNPGATKYGYLVKDEYDGGVMFAVNFVNNSDEVLEIRECDISMVNIQMDQGHKKDKKIPEVEVAGGLKFGSSQDEIREAFGEPDYYYEGDEGSFDSLSYDNGSYDYETKFYVYDDKGITDFKLENDVKKPSINIDYNIDESLIAYEEPEYEEEEKPKRQNKKKLSNDWLDMEFSIDGEIYTMPGYFGFLAEGGWEIKDSEFADGYVLNPGEMTFGTIDITNKEYDKDLLFWVGFANTSDRVKDISECSIYSIKVDTWFLQDEPLEDVPELVVANGITWGSTAEDIMDAFGEPDYEQNEEDRGYSVYTYNGDKGETLKFIVYDEYGVTCIEYEL